MIRDPAVTAARARAAAARAQLDSSIVRAKVRLSPRTLAADAVDSATDKAREAAQTGIQVARERPAVTAAVLGAVGMLLARKPLFGWIGRRRHHDEEDATLDATVDPSASSDQPIVEE